MLLQKFKAFEWPIVYNKGLVWRGGYILIAALFPVLPDTGIVEHLFLGITAISLAYTLPNLAESVLGGRDVSYGVYIYHGLIINILVQTHRTASYGYIGVIFITTFAVASLSWHFVESPMLHWKKRTISVSPPIVAIPIVSTAND